MTMKLVFAAMIATATVPVLAQTATPHIDQREQRQEQRIQQGEQSGSLTNKEASHLEKGQAHLDTMEGKAAADGKVTHDERQRLRHAENVQNRHIEKQKHDRQHDYNHNGVTDHRG